MSSFLEFGRGWPLAFPPAVVVDEAGGGTAGAEEGAGRAASSDAVARASAAPVGDEGCDIIGIRLAGADEK